MPVIVDDPNGDIIAGGGGTDGDLLLKSTDNRDRIRLNAGENVGSNIWVGGNGANGSLWLFPADGDNRSVNNTTIQLNGEGGDIIAGGNGEAGQLSLRGPEGQRRLRLDGRGGKASLGGNGAHGELKIFKDTSEAGTFSHTTIGLFGHDAEIVAGGDGVAGKLTLQRALGQPRIQLDGNTGNATLGGNSVDGDLSLFSAAHTNSNPRPPTVHIDGGTGDMTLGSGVVEGTLVMTGLGSRKRIEMNGKGRLHVGGSGEDGFVALYGKGDENGSSGNSAISLNADKGEFKILNSFRFIDGTLRLGGSGGFNGRLMLRNSSGLETISVEGEQGDIILANADCAEDFDLAVGEESIPGAVMVLSDDGSLRQSETEYDTAVAGIISGAGTYRPGIVLDRHASKNARVPLAMVGKVFCLVDADFGAVRAGTLLTTSSRRGHAMRAADPLRAFGAVIGKALKPLERGQALIPVMVALQ